MDERSYPAGWWLAADGRWYPPTVATDSAADVASSPARRISLRGVALIGSLAVLVVGLVAAGIIMRNQTEHWHHQEIVQHARADGLDTDLSSTKETLTQTKSDLSDTQDQLSNVKHDLSNARDLSDAMGDVSNKLSKCIDDMNDLMNWFIGDIVGGVIDDQPLESFANDVGFECTDAKTAFDQLDITPSGTT